MDFIDILCTVLQKCGNRGSWRGGQGDASGALLHPSTHRDAHSCSVSIYFGGWVLKDGPWSESVCGWRETGFWPQETFEIKVIFFFNKVKIYSRKSQF